MKSKILLALVLILMILALKATANTSIVVRKIYTHYPMGKVIGAVDLDNDKYKEVISCTYTEHKGKIAIILVDFKLNKTQELGLIPGSQKCIEAFKVNETVISVVLYNKSAITILTYNTESNETSINVLSDEILKNILNKSLILASSIGDYDNDGASETLLYLMESKMIPLENYIIYVDPVEKIYKEYKIVENIGRDAKYCFPKKAIPVNTTQGYQELTILLLCNLPLPNQILVVKTYVKDNKLYLSNTINYHVTDLELKYILEANMVIVNSKPLIVFYGMSDKGVKTIALWNNKTYILDLNDMSVDEVLLSVMAEKKALALLDNNIIVLGRIFRDPGVVVIDLNNRIVKTYLFPQDYKGYEVFLDDVGNIDNSNGKDYIAITLNMFRGGFKVLYMDLMTLNASQIFETNISGVEDYGGGLISNIDDDNVTEVIVSVKDRDKGYTLYLLDPINIPQKNESMYQYIAPIIALIPAITLIAYFILRKKYR